MILSFTDTYDIDRFAFETTGAYDPVIGIDSLLFVDPALLGTSSAPEFLGARDEVERYFGYIIKLLSDSEYKGDKRWSMAEKLLTFTEIRGTNLGYCGDGNAGSGIGPKLRNSVLESVSILIDCGITDPNIFELIGVFEKDVGPDRISDLITFILRKRIAKYTERIAEQSEYNAETITYEERLVPKHPTKDEAVLLLPKDILSPLPVATSMADIDYVCSFNKQVRKVINEYFPWEGKRRKPSKSEIKEAMMEHPDFAQAILDTYHSVPKTSYDFTSDNEGTTRWYEDGKRLAKDNPFNMDDVSVDDPTAVARIVCAQFKRLVEDNGAWRLLYDEAAKKARTEKYSQNLFLVVASTYCEAAHLDIDVSPEPNSGNGPVDFKLSRGRNEKCLVELKMSSSRKLRRCIDEQIPTYMQAESAKHAVYLLVQTGNDKQVEDFVRYYGSLPNHIRSTIELVIVDARPKASASKR